MTLVLWLGSVECTAVTLIDLMFEGTSTGQDRDWLRDHGYLQLGSTEWNLTEKGWVALQAARRRASA